MLNNPLLRELTIKSELIPLMKGELNHYFHSEEELLKFRQTSFIYNYINIIDDKIVFQYSDIKVSFSKELIDTYYLFSTLRDMVQFQRAYRMFCRDFKINQIIE